MGRGGQNSAATAGKDGLQTSAGKWENVVRIDNVEYDVTNFVKRHPGGNIIKYGLAEEGADATALFNAFHLRSEKAHKMLKALPQREPQLKLQPGQVPEENSKEGEMLRDFAKLEKELMDEGFFEPSLAHDVYRVAELAALFALGVFLFTLQTTPAILAGVAVHGLFGARCGWLQHEAGHGSFVKSIPLGKHIQSFFIGFGLGTSGDLWNNMHSKHHACAQKIGHDMDLDTTPFVAFFNSAFEKNRWRGFNKWWVRFQAFTFIPVVSGGFVMLFWLLVLHPRHVVKRGLPIQGLWMLSSHIVRTALFKLATGWTSWAACYAVGYWGAMWVSGMYLFGHFSLSHTHLDVVEADVHKSFVRYAVDHTIDISPSNPLVCWIMGYLNLQVLHHLWPQMPQFRQVEASRRFAAFAEKHGLNYRVMSYFGAWGAMFGNLDNVGRHYHEHGLAPREKKTKAN